MKENCFRVLGNPIARFFGYNGLIVFAILTQFSSALARQKNTDSTIAKDRCPTEPNCKGFVWCKKGGD